MNQRHWRANLVVCSLGSFTTIVGMTLILPILPLYVQELGVSDPGRVAFWSGLTYAATFASAALTAPLWGHLGDRFGRKPMLIRASLGMAVATCLVGLAENVWQLLGLRLLVGLLGGYASGSTILVAAQTPKEHSATALGTLAAAIMAGTVVGPLIGATLTQVYAVEVAFVATAGLIFLAFLGTLVFLREDRPQRSRDQPARPGHGWSAVPRRPLVLTLLALSGLLTFATFSVEPVITVFVRDLGGSSPGLPIRAALVFSLTALGTILSAPILGRVADRVGHLRVLAASLAVATVLLAVQSLSGSLPVFAGLRFATGLALGGIAPTVVATIRALLPEGTVGLVLGYNVSAQYLGQVLGPISAGLLAGWTGPRWVFLATAVVTGCGLVAVQAVRRREPELTRPGHMGTTAPRP